jgi:uncharacterized repeat protein (TIGR01451 family)
MKSQTASPRSSHRPSLTRIAAFVALIVFVALMVFPVFSSSMASSSSNIIRPENALGTADQSSARVVKRVSKLESMWAVPGLAALARTKSWFSASPSMALAGETVELFAADCTTPKTAFSLGETVCAKTDGVDLTVPGNHYMNWIDSQLNQTNGGTITQNPQFFLFVPPAADTWKATIGRVAPADSSIIGNPPLFTVSNGPGISTYTPDCLTPKTSFVLGDQVCATAAATGGAAARRRVVWIDPSGNARQVDNITTDPQSFSFSIPLTETSVVGDQIVDNRGNWKVNIISSRSSVVATATFVVTNPVNPSADLSAVKFSESSTVSSGSNTKFFISVYNNGPDAAVNAVLSDPLPANTTFYSITQPSGPSFTCTTPNIGSAGTVNCTIGSLPRDTTAQFELTVQVDTGASANSVITNTATVSSDTADANSDNDSSSGSVSVSGNGGGGACTVACPDDIQTPANTVDQNNNSGAIVHFSAPSGTEGCGTITVDHCNDCFFPQGDTVVTGTDSTTDQSCSFTVTVTAAGSAPTISCPGNKTADADANVCSTNVNVGTATATGNNVTVIGFRSDGQPMYTCDEFGNCTRNSSDAPFNAGTTTITWYAYAHDVAGPYTAQTGDEESHRTGSATCTQTVMVNDVTPPVIGATNSTGSADASCQAAIPDYSSTVTDNCACGSADDSEACEGHPHIVYTQTPAAGTLVGLGPHTVHIEATDGSSNNNGATKDVTFTVNDTTAPAITCPANMTANTAPGTCSASVNPGTATATDNCDSSVTITSTRSDGQALNAPYPKGTTTITWRATDDAGNFSECAQTVTVEDHENPVIVCPANITTVTAPNTCSASVNPGTATATDNCPGTTVSGSRSDGQPLNALYPKGTTTITWTATDSSGNQSSCSQTITVNDTQPPAITCQADIIADFDPAVNGATVTYTTPVGTDNCPGATTVRTAGPASGSVFPTGTTTVTFQVTDAVGLTATCSFKVTVALTSLIGLDSVTMTGSAYIDSYSSIGGYPATKGSQANVLSNGTITMGNSAKIWGNARSTRAGINMTGASQITGNATAATTVTTSGSASVGGTRTNNSPGPVMTLPAVTPCGPPYSSAAGISGTYSYNASTGDLTLSGVNIATLANGNYCFHNVTLGNSSQLKVNGLVVIKMTGTLNTSGASNLNNTTQIPGNLRILSSYSGSNGVVLGNSTAIYAVLYSPNTGLNISGAVPLFGTFAGKVLIIGNSGAIHYDTQMKTLWPAIWALL